MIPDMIRLGAVGAIVSLAGLRTVHAQETSYQLVHNHTGSNFFNDFIFYNGIDTNNTGNVLYQTQEQAAQLGLTSVNAAGNVIIKVDNTTSGVGNPTFGRPSVRVLSSYTLTTGNLILFDAVHMPYGCSVWPAFWTQGPTWPDDGEIDIVEGVNVQATNKVSLHTLNGCTHPPASASSGIETGSLISTDCFNQTNFNQGCIVEVPGNSYGANFAQNGGGVYAVQWAPEGISMWFFPRANVPADLPTDTPKPAGWGLPTAFYPTSSCDTSKFIKPQTLILQTTICGNFAGQPNIFSSGCTGNCLDLVQIPSNYDTAYWEIKYVKVFQATNGSATTSSSGSSTTTTVLTSGGSSTQTGSSQSPNSAVRVSLLSTFSLSGVIVLQIVGGYFLAHS